MDFESKFLHPRDRGLEESVLAAFDSSAAIAWDVKSKGRVAAHFSSKHVQVTVTFLDTGDGSWRVGFEVERSSPEVGAREIAPALRILSGVFQAVREFLEVRQPQRLVFASKDDDLARLYDTYLQKQDTALKQMGYEVAPPLQSSPFTEFTIEKKSPSEWHEDIR
jgi:hypothetical protein